MRPFVLCLLFVGTFCDVQLISAGVPGPAGTAGSSGTNEIVATPIVATPIVAPMAPVAPVATTAGKASLFISGSQAETTVPKVKLSIFQDPQPLPALDLTGPNSTDFIGEFETALTGEQRAMAANRSEASRGQTLRLTRDDMGRELRITLCARSPRDSDTVAFQVENIRFSNDGPSDRIYLSLNGQPLGDVNTGDDYRGGEAWNVFKSTGRIGPVRVLRNGDHTLAIRVEADQWGVELDTLTIRAKGQSENELFMCKAILV